MNHRHKAFQASALPLSYPGIKCSDYIKKFIFGKFFFNFLLKKEIKGQLFPLFLTFWNSIIIKKISCNFFKKFSRRNSSINTCSRPFKLYNYYKFWIFNWSISSIRSICPTWTTLVSSFIKNLCCSSFSCNRISFYSSSFCKTVDRSAMKHFFN